MRICLVVDSLDVGGAERHVVDLAQGLTRHGHDVVVACSTAGPLAEHLADGSIQVVPLLGRRVKRSVSPRYALALGRFLRVHQFDVVHAHLYSSEIAAALATAALATPLVLTEHSERTWQRWWQSRISTWTTCRADHVIGVSSGICRLLARDGVERHLLSLIANASGPPTAADREPAVLPERLLPGALLAGVVGRLCQEKGHEIFLEAVARVTRELPHVRFLVIGDGPLMPTLVSRSRRLCLESRLRFLGERPNARAIIAALDLLVVPSLSEGSPLVVREALAAGVPVLATRVGDIPDVVEPRVNGLLVPPGDEDSLAAALVDLLKDTASLDSLRAGVGVHRAVPDHESVLARVEEIYGAVLAIAQAKKGRPRLALAGREDWEGGRAGVKERSA